MQSKGMSNSPTNAVTLKKSEEGSNSQETPEGEAKLQESAKDTEHLKVTNQNFKHGAYLPILRHEPATDLLEPSKATTVLTGF